MLSNWIGDTYDKEITNVSMKPVLADLLEEAYKIAICDSIFLKITDERRKEIFEKPDCILEKEWNSISPIVLIRNTANRFFGSGGWTVRGVYAGNATPQQNFDACVEKR